MYLIYEGTENVDLSAIEGENCNVAMDGFDVKCVNRISSANENIAGFTFSATTSSKAMISGYINGYINADDMTICLYKKGESQPLKTAKMSDIIPIHKETQKIDTRKYFLLYSWCGRNCDRQ